jgi:predicted nucleotide-binding protein
MPKINQDLIERIAGKLGITSRAVYPLIQKVVAETMLERNLAALVLALRHGININRYSTPQQRNELRGAQSKPAGEDRASRPELPIVPRHASGARKTKHPKKGKGNSVFVVHGRDEELRRSMFAFLRALGLNPMEWAHAVETARGANPYLGEILDSAMEKVQAVVVLFSPDELAQLKEQFCGPERQTEGKLEGQPRPNVLFEAGLALGAHPDKTLLVQVGKVRGFSDIAGKHFVRLSNDVGKRNEVATRLAKIGCAVNKIGNDWMTEGLFVPTEPKARKKKIPANSRQQSTRQKRR